PSDLPSCSDPELGSFCTSKSEWIDVNSLRASDLWLISIGFVWRFFDDSLAQSACRSVNPRANLAGLRTVKLSPALITWLFHSSCTTVKSSGLVSACQRTHPPSAALPLGDTRACVKH